MARHFEQIISISATPESIFEFVDNHKNFSSHMNKRSLFLGGGRMDIILGDDNGKKIGSHIKMTGRVFGIELFVDEVITKYEPPYKKVWETDKKTKILIINKYMMGFELATKEEKTVFKVFIDYEIPKTFIYKILGYVFADLYAKWCVKQIIEETKYKF